MKYFKILNATAMFSFIFCKLAMAANSGYCNAENTCEWKVENGVLTISGSGAMQDYWYTWENGVVYSTTPWAKEDISSVVVGKNIISTGQYAFANLQNLSSVTFEKGSNLERIGPNNFENTKVNDLLIPEKVTSIGWWAFSNRSVHLYCTKEQINNNLCSGNFQNNKNIAVTHYEQNGMDFVVYDGDEILGIYDSYSAMKNNNRVDAHLWVDGEGKIIAKYDGNGNILQSYTHNPDGSVSITDANGKLIGLKNAKSITPAQAAALVKKGNHNTVTLTFK